MGCWDKFIITQDPDLSCMGFDKSRYTPLINPILYGYKQLYMTVIEQIFTECVLLKDVFSMEKLIYVNKVNLL